MKTIAAWTALVALNFGLIWGQCVPVPGGCVPQSGLFCLSGAFEPATVGVNYSHSAQFFHAGWKVLPGDAVVYFRKIQVDSVTGLPAGLILTIKSLNADDGPQGLVYQGANGPVNRPISRVGSPAEGFAACFAVTGNPNVATYVHDSVTVHVTPYYSDLDEGEGSPDIAGAFAPRRYTFKMPVVFSPDGEFYFGLDTPAAEYCTGQLLQLGAFADPPHGVNFRWEPAEYVLDPHVAHPIVFPPSTTIFTVSAFNEIIEYSATVTVQVFESPYVNLGPDLVLNDGETLTLDAGPYGMYYEWNTGATDRYLLVDSPGEYAVEVFASNGCWATDTVRVFAAGGFYLEAPAPAQVVCGASVPVQLTLIPPDAPVSISWSPTTGVHPPNGLSVILSPTQTTVYTVTATDGQTTFQTQVQAFVVSPLNLPPQLTFVPGGAVVLDAGPADGYLWNTGEITRTVVADEQGDYWVEAQYANCPTGRDTVRVRVDGHVVSGRVYRDLNINSTYESGEPGFHEIVVWAADGENKFYASTRSDGFYELYLPDGNWYVTCRYPDYFAQTQPFSGGYSFVLSGENQTIPGTDFGFGDIPAPFSDLRATLFRRTPTPDFPAQTPSSFVIEYQNVGNHVQSGSVELRLDPKTTFFYASPYPDGQQPLRWDFQNLAPGEKRRIHVQISGESAQNIFEHRGEITGLAQDQTPWDNISVCRYFTGDAGELGGLYRVVEGSDSLNVQLGFYHVEPLPKLNVVLRDTLGGVTPPEAIWSRAATHDYEFKVKGRGTVEWRMMGALLPAFGAEAGTGVGAVRYSTVAAYGAACSVPYSAAAGVRMDDVARNQSTFLPNYFNPAPEFDTTVPDSVEVHQSVEFLAHITGEAEAAWNFGADAVPQALAGPGPHVVKFLSTGPKQVVFSVWRGVCRTDSIFDVYVKDTVRDTVPVSRSRLSYAPAPSVYPNPARDVFFVKYPKVRARWELTDVLGKVVSTGILDGSAIVAPPPGIYGLRVEDATIKVVVSPR